MLKKKLLFRMIVLLPLAVFFIQSASADFTIVVLPDTQVYSESNPEIFMAQTEWIRDNAEKENIVFVVHEGDIVNQQNNHTQWRNAQKALRVLDDANIPYILSVGNHDMGSDDMEDANDRDTSTYNEYFNYKRFDRKEWYGDHLRNDNDNYYVLFEADGLKFMILSLEFGPNGEIIEWANRVVAENQDKRVIVVTHAYMDSDDTRLGLGDRGNPHWYGIEDVGIERYVEFGSDEWNEIRNESIIFVPTNIEGRNIKVYSPEYEDGYILDRNIVRFSQELDKMYYINEKAPFDGDETWNFLIKKHENIFMVLSGHVLGDGSGKLTSVGEEGNKVHQMIANYQFLPNGGDGWMRLMMFKPGEDKIEISSYSPWLKEDDFYKYSESYNIWEYNFLGVKSEVVFEDEHDFDLDYEMAGSLNKGITGAAIGVDSGSKVVDMFWFWFVSILVIAVIIMYFFKKEKKQTSYPESENF